MTAMIQVQTVTRNPKRIRKSRILERLSKKKVIQGKSRKTKKSQKILEQTYIVIS